MYRVQHHGYCGLSGIPATYDDRQEARDYAASRIRRARKRFTVVTLERGKRWEVQEPPDCMMVPDACGILAIHRTTFECRECGCDCETKQQARDCCAYSEEYADE